MQKGKTFKKSKPFYKEELGKGDNRNVNVFLVPETGRGKASGMSFSIILLGDMQAKICAALCVREMGLLVQDSANYIPKPNSGAAYLFIYLFV